MTVNRGLSGLPIDLDCIRCGQPITVDFMAHGDGDPSDLVSDPMQQLVIAAARAAIKQDGQQLCSTCADLNWIPGGAWRWPRKTAKRTS